MSVASMQRPFVRIPLNIEHLCISLMMLGFAPEGLVRALLGKKFEVYTINLTTFICT